jgi:hypothetical protein
MLLAMIFASTTSVFAAGISLEDSELDSIDAGEYVIVDAGNGFVKEDVFYNSNGLLLIDESQKDIQSVSNANAVDSAVAVQTNTSSVEGNEPINNDINQSNEANIANYNPRWGKKTWDNSATTTITSNSLHSEAQNSASSHDSWDSWDTWKAGGGFDYLETLDVDFDAAAAGESRGSHFQSSAIAAVATLDVDYDKKIGANWSEEGSWHELGVWDSMNQASNSTTSIDTLSTTIITEKGDDEIEHKSEWNALSLEDTSQTNIHAVSNLNSVGSAVAVQTNIASNVGVAGIITHSNVATVINGL